MDDVQTPADDSEGVNGGTPAFAQKPDYLSQLFTASRHEGPDAQSIVVAHNVTTKSPPPDRELHSENMEIDTRMDPRTSTTEPTVKRSPVDESFPAGMAWQGDAPPQDEHGAREQREASPTSDRPLNVGDALSYLDAVKKTFSESPTVYNKFLDIMKDFKNQTIDTPGVIQRVSSLFAGFPPLIEGFNTFLPAGYRIECTVDRETNVITVTTPEGTTTHSQVTIVDDSAFARKLWARFGGREDLYREFMDIIKDNENSAEAQHLMAQRMANVFEQSPNLLSSLLDVLPPSLADVMQKAAALDCDRRSRQSKRKAPEPAPPASSGQRKKRKNLARDERGTEYEMDYKTSASQSKSRQLEHDHTQPEGSRHHRGRAINNTHSNVRTHSNTLDDRSRNPRLPSIDDYSFFDRVKLAIDSRETYNEFLKLINYFTQGIIDMRRLVDASRTFLNDDLMMQFKKILGWDPNWDIPLSGAAAGRSEGMERVTKESLRIRQGPSYRRLPASEANVSCSGRDEMCKSVLNDEWMSHPTWSSEDGGFIGHRKNVYEEALHRSEEERHEYDFHIEAIVRTISLLEPLNFKILQMSPEDRSNFKPKLPFMSGVSKAIFQRIVKKVYGRDAGLEVIQCVHDQPAVAIPILYARLRQKDAEWKKAQKEWNKVWREVDARNYQKSLDHQGIIFKAADKKAITAKTFLNQLESARDEQLSRRASLVDPTFARTRPRYHMAFGFDDIGVLQDVFKLTFSLLDRMHHNIIVTDRRRIEGFLRTFIPMFFMLDPIIFGEALQSRTSQFDFPITDDFSNFVDELDENAPSQGASRTGRNARRAGGDLRKKILKSHAHDKKKSTLTQFATALQLDAQDTSATIVSPGVVEETPPSSAGSVDIGQESPTQPKEQQTRRATFFGNSYFYTLFRLIELLYSRLKTCKDLATMLANDPSSPYLSNPLASELALLTSESAYPKLAAIQKGPSPASQFYPFLLETCERLFDNAIDSGTFEEILRGLFGTKAYVMFTFDKVIGALIKQVQNIISDGKSLPILDNLKREREMPSPTILDFDDIRAAVEKVLAPEENLFRLDWTPTTRSLTIQLLGKDDANFEDVDMYNGRWQAYMDSFVSDSTTKGMENLNVKPPFLSRNFRTVKQHSASRPSVSTSQSDEDVAFGQSALEIKICVRTYRMFFVAGTEDCMWHTWVSGAEELECERRHRLQVQKSESWMGQFEETGRLPGSAAPVDGKDGD